MKWRGKVDEGDCQECDLLAVPHLLERVARGVDESERVVGGVD